MNLIAVVIVKRLHREWDGIPNSGYGCYPSSRVLRSRSGGSRPVTSDKHAGVYRITAEIIEALYRG